MRLDPDSTDRSKADFANARGSIRVVGHLTLNYVPVRCVADIDLSSLSGTGHLERNDQGELEPDPELRDTESVRLSETIESFFEREVKPHVPDAWIDRSKCDKQDHEVGIVGYEINFNRYFYRYTPPRDLADIESDIRGIEKDIVRMLAEVTGSGALD